MGDGTQRGGDRGRRGHRAGHPGAAGRGRLVGGGRGAGRTAARRTPRRGWTRHGGGRIIVGDAADRDVLAAAAAAARELAPLRGWVNNAAVVATDSVHSRSRTGSSACSG